MNNSSNLKCINCGGRQIQLAIRGTVKLKDALKSAPYFITDANFGKFENIYKCMQCDLYFVDRFRVEEDLKEYYKNQSLDLDYLANENGRRKTAGRILDKLANFKKSGQNSSSLLDIGCGPGIFISEAKKKGWNIFGIDLSLKNVDFARNNLHMPEVILGSAEEINSKFEESYFDAITAFDVIEHLSDPKKIVSIIHKKLKPGGLLVMTVPLIDSLTARFMGKRWHALVPAHLNYFSKKSLKNFYESLGYELVYERHYVRYLSLDYLLKRLSGNSNFNIPKPINLILPVNLFDEVEIYLRKI